MQPVTFSHDDLSLLALISQTEIIRMSEIAEWFEKRDIEFPSEKNYRKTIAALTVIRDKVNNLYMEGIGNNGTEYVLRQECGNNQGNINDGTGLDAGRHNNRSDRIK